MTRPASVPLSGQPEGAAQITFMEPHDLPEVLTLYRQLWLQEKDCAPRAMEEYFSRIFFDHPWPDDSIRSLVCRNADGRVVGCLGVMPRHMRLAGKPIRVAVSHNFMVDPNRRATMAAIELMKAFFAGPQDLSLAEGNSLSRKLWEGLGGTTALLHNFRWVRPLRPAGFLLRAMKGRGVPPWLHMIVSPCSAAADALLHMANWTPFRCSPGAGRSEELQIGTFVELASRWTEARWLWPQYDQPSISWLFDMLRRKRGMGSLRSRLVTGPNGDNLGSYVYYAKTRGISEVLHLLAKPATIGPVLDDLFYDAWSQGSSGISGQLDPRWMNELTARHCLFQHSGSWMLVHSKMPSVLDCIHQGKAFLSRLDGEWWIGLHEGSL